MRLDVVRLELDGPLEAGQGLLRPAVRPQDDAQIVVDDGIGRSELDFCPFKGRFLGTAPRRFAAQAAGAKAARITARKTRGRFSNTSV